jgi:hypothetical protein
MAAHFIDVTDYGVLSLNTGAQNNAAWLAVKAAAAALGIANIRFPVGVFKFSTHGLVHGLSGGVAAPLVLDASLTVSGAGIDQTVLKSDGWVEPTYGNSDPSTIVTVNDEGTALIHCFGAGVDVRFFDISLEGPPAGDLTHGRSNIWGIYAAGGGSLHLERVKMILWNQAIKCSPNYPNYPGNGTRLTAIDCHIRFRGNGILHGGFGVRVPWMAKTSNFTINRVLTGGTSGATGVIVGSENYPGSTTGVVMLKDVAGIFVNNEVITDSAGGSAVANGDQYGGADTNDQLRCTFEYHRELPNLITALPLISQARHCNYIANGCSFRTVQCSFLASGGSAGEGGFGWRHYSVGDPDVPKYSESLGDYFASHVASAYCTNPNFVTTVIGATTHTANGNHAVDVSGPAKFTGCHFVGEPGASNGIQDGAFVAGQATIENSIFEGDFLYAVYRVLGTADRWKVGPNVEFNHSSSSGGGGIRCRAGGMDLDGAVLNVQGAGTGASAFFTGGDIRMANTRFAVGCKYAVISPSDIDVSVEFLPGNVWDEAGSVPLITPGAHNIVFKGQANWPESLGQGVGMTISGSPGTTISGQMQCGRGVGAYTYANNVLTVNWNYSAYIVHEVGTPMIKNINMKGGTGVGVVPSDHIKAGSPGITLVAGRPFSLGKAGNIALASSPLLVRVNTAVELQWFPARGKWYLA